MVRPRGPRRRVGWLEIGAPRNGVAGCSDVALTAAYWARRRTAGRNPMIRAGAMLAIFAKTALDADVSLAPIALQTQ